jgi:ParB-like chromosome segregation protein Spo0J
MENIILIANQLIEEMEKITDLSEKIKAVNAVRTMIHEICPMNKQPVDLVLWIKSTDVHANDYNPNNVAPPEMKLLEHSILCDGYTQPIVCSRNGGEVEVVDGFHRNRVGKECAEVSQKVQGYLPVVALKGDHNDKNARVSSTIRHNRARGKHQVDKMSDIVRDLSRRNWSDKKISTELGMTQDEVLRLKQMTGLAEIFKNTEFSEAWEIG